jgi:hypothetical protein
VYNVDIESPTPIRTSGSLSVINETKSAQAGRSGRVKVGMPMSINIWNNELYLLMTKSVQTINQRAEPEGSVVIVMSANKDSYKDGQDWTYSRSFRVFKKDNLASATMSITPIIPTRDFTKEKSQEYTGPRVVMVIASQSDGRVQVINGGIANSSCTIM